MGKYERSDDNVCCCDANKSGRGGLISDFVNDDRCRRSAAASSPNSDSETSIINQQDDHGSRCPKEVKEMVTVTSGPTNTYTSSAVSGMEEYVSLYKESLDDPSGFWLKMSRSLYFHTPPPNPSSIFEYNFDPAKGPVYTRFMAGATTNVSYNCIDVHVNNGLANKVALLWEGNDSSNKCEELTYGTLLSRVCRFANGLKALGVGPGDVVAIYMPMVPDIAVAMLACTRIGAVHSVIFAGYSAEWLAERLTDGKVRVLITADGSTRGNKHVQLKLIANEAMVRCRDNHRHQVSHCVVLNNCNRQEELPMMTVGRDLWWDEVTAGQPEECEPVWVDAEAPLFILYTSGSTGRPKGMVHTTAGYLLFASTVFKYSFDFRTNDVFWGTSDMGWCAAHTNILYGPLSLGGTTLLLEGPPFHPSSSRPWDVIEKYGVTQFYTAPTVIRHLMNCPPAATPDQQKLKSLRVLGSVGEPMHPQVWQWYFSVVGGSRCPIVDTYGQTETGGHLLTSVPGTAPVHLQQLIPFFGVDPTIAQSKDHDLLEKDEDEGGLAFTQPWPALARAIHGDDDGSNRYTQSYFSHVNGAYFTGDGMTLRYHVPGNEKSLATL